MLKNKYRVILNNKNLCACFSRYHWDHDKARLTARITKRTYSFFNLSIYEYEYTDSIMRERFSDVPKIGFTCGFSKSVNFTKFKGVKIFRRFDYSFNISNGDNFFQIDDVDLVNDFVKDTKIQNYIQ